MYLDQLFNIPLWNKKNCSTGGTTIRLCCYWLIKKITDTCCKLVSWFCYYNFDRVTHTRFLGLSCHRETSHRCVLLPNESCIPVQDYSLNTLIH